MNVVLWILQVLLALHTTMGAVWKYSNSEQRVPSLQAIPHGAWLTLGVLELVCCVGLVLPAVGKPLAILAPVAAACIAAEMLLFCGLHLRSGVSEHGPMVYWVVVAVFSGFVAYGRFVLQPH
jgi:hypothetical protein